MPAYRCRHSRTDAGRGLPGPRPRTADRLSLPGVRPPFPFPFPFPAFFPAFFPSLS